MAAGNTIANAPPLLLAAVAIADHRIRREIGGRVSSWIQTTPHTVTLTVRVGDLSANQIYHAGELALRESDLDSFAGVIRDVFVGRLRGKAVSV